MNKLIRNARQYFEKHPSDMGWILAATTICACAGALAYERKNIEAEPVVPISRMIPTNAANWETLLHNMH